MVNHVALNEQFEMRRMGYSHRAFFTNPFGVPFHKDFSSGEEMEQFIQRAQEVGTQLNGIAGIMEEYNS